MTESPTTSVIKDSATTSQSPQQQMTSEEDRKNKAQKAAYLLIQDISSQVAQFRDLLINIGQAGDSPELREGIRRLRRTCVDACKTSSQLILPQVRRTTEIGIPVDCPNLMLLFYIVQLFLRELCKCKNLVRIVHMDIKEYYEVRTGSTNIGNVISQILLHKQITPNLHEEELMSIKKDSDEIRGLIHELQEFMPQSGGDTEKYAALQNAGARGHRANGRRGQCNQSNEGQPRTASQPSYLRGALNFFCCTAKSNYM